MKESINQPCVSVPRRRARITKRENNIDHWPMASMVPSTSGCSSPSCALLYCFFNCSSRFRFSFSFFALASSFFNTFFSLFSSIMAACVSSEWLCFRLLDKKRVKETVLAWRGVNGECEDTGELDWSESRGRTVEDEGVPSSRGSRGSRGSETAQRMLDFCCGQASGMPSSP